MICLLVHKKSCFLQNQEKNITDAELEPLKKELSTLESSILDQIELIRSAKKNIIKNDDKIQRMISNTILQGRKD